MASHVFTIETGKFGLSLVDTADSGYLASWQTPDGIDIDSLSIDDYVSGSLGDWTCQVTSGALTASPNTSTDSTPATFCGPEETTTTVGVTSYSLDVTFLQDPDLMNGLNRYLFQHDTEEAYFYLGLNDDDPPKAAGRLRIISGTIGGDARTKLTATLSLPLTRKPNIIFGTLTGGTATVEGGATADTITATGATSAGSFTPPGSTPPANLAAMSGVTASPGTAWTGTQHVVLGDATSAKWNGTTWVVYP